MPSLALRNWFGRSVPVELSRPPPLIAKMAEDLEYEPPPEGTPNWPPERLAVADSLWGGGYQLPGGEIEFLRLAKPLGLSAASTLLLVGAGAGGAACALAARLGVWVVGFEADESLVADARQRIGGTKLGKRAQAEVWDPFEPAFERHAYHHGLAIQPLRGGLPEPVLASISGALKPGGQLTLVELVADSPLDARDPDTARWAALERRAPEGVPTETTVTRVLGRLGFDVRVAEDISRRHADQALLGWRTRVRRLEEERPPPREAAALVAEAEFWLVRLRLFRAGALRMVRWHGIGRGT